MSDIAEDILSLLSKKGKVNIGEIQDKFNLTEDTLTPIIDFLHEFGFIKFNESKRFIMLSPKGKKFFEDS